MRTLAFLIAVLAIAGCGKSGGSDSLNNPESPNKNAPAQQGSASSEPAPAPSGSTASASNPGASSEANAGAPDGHEGHNHGPEGNDHGSNGMASAPAASIESKQVEGEWSGTGDGTNGKEAYAMTIKPNMAVAMTVTPEGAPAATYEGRWELEQDAVIMHLLKVTIRGDARDIHTDLVWKLEDGKLVLQTGPATGKVKLSRKG